MPRTPRLGARALIDSLAAVRGSFGPEAAREKRSLIGAILPLRISSRSALLALHESLLFLRAYPDSEEVLALAEEGLTGFAERVAALDEAARDRLDDTGIAGTAIHSGLLLPTAAWLSELQPGALAIFDDGDEEGSFRRLFEVLLEVLPPAELEALADGYLDAATWLERTRQDKPLSLDRLLTLLGRDTKNAASTWAALDLPIRWELGSGPCSRTLNRAPSTLRALQDRPFDRARPDLAATLAGAPPAFRPLPQAEARAWIDAARAAMASRVRILYAFNHASAADVTAASLAGGLEIAFVGTDAARRIGIRTYYGFLITMNGVPIAYGDLVLLFEWGEINFHVFDTFRQASSAQIYAETVRAVHHWFGTAFVFLNRYQFGHDNPDAIRSGAFWFYEKLGFRPTAPEPAELWRAERKKIERHPRHRTTPATLKKLASAHMTLTLTGDEHLQRRWTGFHPQNLGVAASRRAEAAGRRLTFEELRDRLGAGSWSEAERGAFDRAAPILDLARWDDRDLDDLSHWIRAKASPRERDALGPPDRYDHLAEILAAAGRES